jgi:vacuolar-type H+-ATPase subunit B/Vma2
MATEFIHNLTVPQKKLLQTFLDENFYTISNGYAYSMLMAEVIKRGTYSEDHRKVFNQLRDMYLKKQKQHD